MAAGKSTLIKVLTGVEEFETGEISDRRLRSCDRSTAACRRHRTGASALYQEVNLCPNLTVAENLFIGREPRKGGLIDWKTMNKKASKLLQDLDIHADVTQTIDNYSIALQQMIAIARSRYVGKGIDSDEPTSSLDDGEVEKLFNLMRRLKSEGVGIIFVTHFLEQVYAVCDKITVLRNGQLVGQFTTAELPRVQLVAKMMGKDFDDLAAIKDSKSEEKHGEADIVIKAVGLGKKGYIKPFDLVIHKGEVVWIYWASGSGRSETVRVLLWSGKADEGELSVKGRPIAARHPLISMNAGMAYLPEDRKNEGIISDLSVRENSDRALQAKRGMFHLLSRKQQGRIY